MDGDHADDLLKRALIDAEASASVALRVTPLSLTEALTVVFHGRKDLGTVQTYVAHGGRGAGDAVGKDELMRVPCDLDLAAAEDREEAERLFAEQAGALRDALIGADTVLDIWREPFEDLVHDRIRVDRSLQLSVRLPAQRLLPTALVSPEKQIVVTAVCGARSLAEGRPPMGIAVGQQDVDARLPAARRPGALPRGLPRARRRPRARPGGADRATGGVGPALPRAVGRRLPRDGLNTLSRRTCGGRAS